MPRKVLTTVVQDPREAGSIQVEVTLPVSQRRRESAVRGRHRPESNSPDRPRIPRITRLMALAIKFQAMVEGGEVRDYADLARLGYVTRARLTQIMNLALLAPDIQEAILIVDKVAPASLNEHQLRAVARIFGWGEQRRAFAEMTAGTARGC